MSSPQLNTRHEEAAEWFAALQSDLSPTEIRRWERWIVDPDNRASFDAMRSLWNRAKVIEPPLLPNAQALAADDYDGSVPFAEWSAGKPRNTLTTPEQSGASDLRSEPSANHGTARISALLHGRRAFVFAAAVLAAVALAWILYPQIADEPQLYETRVAEHRTVRLPDGSDVLLGAETSLWVTYTRHRRTVLLDRGEVLIHVAPQRKRPFAVLAGNGVITAVGTRFAVKRNPATERVTVTVTEGVVRVEPQSPQVFDEIAPPPIDTIAPTSAAPETRSVIATLSEGRRVSYDERGSLSAVRPVDPESAVAWREGRLLYRDESLREVIADINRYSHREIIFVDGSADALRYTGTVFQGDIDDWIDGLLGIFDLEIVEADAKHVVLRKHHAG